METNTQLNNYLSNPSNHTLRELISICADISDKAEQVLILKSIRPNHLRYFLSPILALDSATWAGVAIKIGILTDIPSLHSESLVFRDVEVLAKDNLGNYIPTQELTATISHIIITGGLVVKTTRFTEEDFEQCETLTELSETSPRTFSKAQIKPIWITCAQDEENQTPSQLKT